MPIRYSNSASPPPTEANDPNGIRTRVTAVKGRCPGPLDDRVIRARPISELPSLHASKLLSEFGNRSAPRTRRDVAAKRADSSFVCLQRVNQRRCARGCCLMGGQNFTRVLDEALPSRAIPQKLSDCLYGGIGILDLDRRFF